jgi:hypothetical protein
MNCPQCGEICRCPSEFDPAPDSTATVAETGDAQAWRDELSDRVSRYRARRKARPPRYPSLSLRFEGFRLPPRATPTSETSPLSTCEPASNQALALDQAGADMQFPPSPAAETAALSVRHTARPLSPGHLSAKIIEFPRFAWGPPAPPPDQLAEPVSGRPRILDVPEVEPAAPALGGITIEAAER